MIADTQSVPYSVIIHVEMGIRDTHIMLFKVPIMLCSDSQHQANYAHHFVPVMLTIISSLQTY